MSTEQLKFKTDGFDRYDVWIVKDDDSNKFVLVVDNKSAAIDRNQAHLLMLYLQEHLK